jgi:transcription antitermination protein NusB
MTADGIEGYFSHFSSVKDDTENEGIHVDVTEFAEALAYGVIRELATLDSTITLAAKNWSVNRMSRVDRNILRVAVYELQFSTEIPVRVVINEAIELAKEFAGEESPHFINGVLDKIARDLTERV